MKIEAVLRVLANSRRLRILHWVKDPRGNFPLQKDGDLVRDGVCGVLIARKLGVSQPSASEHLQMLLNTGLISSKRKKQWIFYKRNADALRAVQRRLAKEL